MPKLKASYDSMSAVPEGYQNAYTEQDGKAVFTGGDFEFKSDADVSAMKTAKDRANTELSEMKEKYKTALNEATDFKSKVEVLTLQAKEGAADPAKLQELVDSKVKAATESLTSQLAEASEKNKDLQSKIFGSELDSVVSKMTSNFSESVQDEASFILKSIVERAEDGRHVSKEAFGIPAGLEPEQIVQKLAESKPHWKKQNTPGNGAGGASGAGGEVSKTKQFNELLKKQQSGKLSHSETKQLNTLANEIKAEQNGDD